MTEDTLRSDVEQKIRARRRKENKEELQKVISVSSGMNNRVNPDYVRNPAAASAEEAIIGMLLYSPELLEVVRRENLLNAEMFQTEFNRRVYTALLESAGADGQPEEGMLSQFFTVEEIGRITGMKVRRAPLTNNGIQVLRECIDRLQKSKTKGNNIEDIEDILGTKRRKKE